MDEQPLLTQEEINYFKQIYNVNYINKNNTSNADAVSFKIPQGTSFEDFTEKPSLLKGVPLSKISEDNNDLIDIDVSYFTQSTEHFNDGTNVYTPAFSNYIENMDKIIKNKSLSDSTKYTLLGKLLSNFKCANNNFNQRFIKFIIQYTKLISHNKFILLNQMNNLLQESVNEIGNCDYSNLEGISNKEVEDAIRTGDVFKMPLRAAINATKLAYSQGKAAVNTVSKVAALASGDSKPDLYDTEYTPLESANKAELTRVRNLASSVRSEIMAMKEFVNNKFCSKLELVNTVKKYPDSAFWLRTPGLVALTTSAVNTGAAFSLNDFGDTTKDLSTYLQNKSSTGQQLDHQIVFNQIDALRIASIVNTVCGPLLGLIIGLSIGTFLESEFYKNLRNSRMINLSFQTFLSKNHYDFTQISECSYRKDAMSYKGKFANSKNNINDYFITAKKYYDDQINNLDFYFFIYDYLCKTINISEIDDTADSADTADASDTGNKTVAVLDKNAEINNFLKKIASKNCSSEIDSRIFTYYNTYKEFNKLSEIDKNQILEDIDAVILSNVNKANCSNETVNSTEFNKISEHIKEKLPTFSIYQLVGDNYDSIIAEIDSCKSKSNSETAKNNYDIFLSKPKEEQIKILISRKITTSNDIKCPTSNSSNNFSLNLSLITGGKKSRKRKTQKRRQKTHRRR
jgi:hypothetical protein